MMTKRTEAFAAPGISAGVSEVGEAFREFVRGARHSALAESQGLGYTPESASPPEGVKADNGVLAHPWRGRNSASPTASLRRARTMDALGRLCSKVLYRFSLISSDKS
jgi:hypothetical protein